MYDDDNDDDVDDAVCNSTSLSPQVGRADILVVGAGKAEMVQGDWVKEGAVVIDCGINHIPGLLALVLCCHVHFQSADVRLPERLLSICGHSSLKPYI